MVNFHEVRLPEDISRGATGGPARKTQIVELYSGFEERNAQWAHSRRSYDIGYGLRNINDAYDVIEFFEAREGRLYGFRFKEWADYNSSAPNLTTTSADQTIGTGNGSQTVFQLTKTYTSGPSSYVRPIKKPVDGTLKLSVNGVTITSGFSVDTTTGLVTITTPPPNGHVVRAGFEFDVPVRFNDDQIDINVENFDVGSVPNIKLIEVRV